MIQHKHLLIALLYRRMGGGNAETRETKKDKARTVLRESQAIYGATKQKTPGKNRGS